MANAKLSDVELKIGLVASLENSKKLGPNNGANNNYWSVDWDLQYLHKYNNHRIFLVLEYGVFIPNTANKTTDNNSSIGIGELEEFLIASKKALIQLYCPLFCLNKFLFLKPGTPHAFNFLKLSRSIIFPPPKISNLSLEDLLFSQKL